MEKSNIITLLLLIIFLCVCSGPKSVDKVSENERDGNTENPEINYERPKNEQIELPRATPPGTPVIGHVFEYPVITLPETSIEIVSVLTSSFLRSVTPPRLISDMDSLYAKLSYPEIARRAGVHGIVIVKFEVDTLGKVQNYKYVIGIGAGCDEQVFDLVNYLQFAPAIKDGKPVNSLMRICVKFELYYPNKL